MLDALINYTAQVLSNHRERGLRPREGLHLVIGFTANGTYTVKGHELYRRTEEPSAFLLGCARLEQVTWTINTNKSLDLPAKGIHSASPFCLAFKRDSWQGGEKYQKDAASRNGTLDQRIGAYFDRAIQLLDPADERLRQAALQFKHFCQNDLASVLASLPAFAQIKVSDYIVVYLAEEQAAYDAYAAANARYLRDKLFNTNEHNVPTPDGRVYGTSDFFTGYNSKKPFLLHQTAPFDINTRISDLDARMLNDFRLIAAREPKVLPNPLPIFVDRAELNDKVLAIFHEDPNRRIGYAEIIRALLKEEPDNYYLLFYRGGEIKDFDFVSKFEYTLSDESQKLDYWEVKDWFGIGKIVKQPPSLKLHNVFDFQNAVVQVVFNNALVQIQKSGQWAFKYYDDIDPKYCSANTYRLVMQYRGAFYDFIYKSRRQAITGDAWRDIMLSGILDDVRANKDISAKQKLNVYVSLNHHFDRNNRNFNNQFMPTELPQLQANLRRLLDPAADSEAVHITTDRDYAYAAGQLIYYLLSQSKAEDKTNELLEPFLQKTSAPLFKEALAQTLRRYKHNISFGFGRFRKLAGEVMGYEAVLSPKELMPFILCGYFDQPELFRKQVKAEGSEARIANAPEPEAVAS